MYIQCNPVLTYSLASENLVRYIRLVLRKYIIYILVSRNSLLLVGKREVHVRAWVQAACRHKIASVGGGTAGYREYDRCKQDFVYFFYPS